MSKHSENAAGVIYLVSDDAKSSKTRSERFAYADRD